MDFLMQLLFKPSLSQWITMLALFVGILGATYLETQTKIEIQVPKRDLPAYYQIKPGDLSSQTYAKKDIPSKILKNSQELVGRYTLTKIPKQKPLTEKLLSSKIDPDRLIDTVAVGIPATPAMTFGGNLQAGDTVEMTLVPTTTKAESLPSPIVFPNILVLDVKSVSQASALSTSVVVVALPLKRQQEFASKSLGATFLLTRKL
jgi:Flp pilus assembly protein CpaB